MVSAPKLSHGLLFQPSSLDSSMKAPSGSGRSVTDRRHRGFAEGVAAGNQRTVSSSFIAHAEVNFRRMSLPPRLDPACRSALRIHVDQAPSARAEAEF